MADEDRFFAPDSKARKGIDDVLRDAARRPAGRDLRPGKTVDAEAFLVAFFPRLDRLHYDRLVFVENLAVREVDDLVGDFEDFMDLGVEPVCLSV